MSRMEDYLMDHNAMSKRPMNLAVFLYAVEHISRIARVLKQPGEMSEATDYGAHSPDSCLIAIVNHSFFIIQERICFALASVAVGGNRSHDCRPSYRGCKLSRSRSAKAIRR